MERTLSLRIIIPILLILFFAAVFPAKANAAEDTTPPKLKGIKVLTSSVKVGGEVKIQIEFEEEETGLARGDLQAYSICEDTEIPKLLVQDSRLSDPVFSSEGKNGVYTCVLETDPDKTINAEWFVSTIYLHDAKGNMSTYHGFPDKSGMESAGPAAVESVSGSTHFTTTGSKVKTDRPKVNWVKIDQTSVARGGKLPIKINITAGRTFVVRLVASETNPKTKPGQEHEQQFFPSVWGKNKTYTFTMQLPKNARTGKWILSTIELVDVNDNISHYDWWPEEDGDYLVNPYIESERTTISRFNVTAGSVSADTTRPKTVSLKVPKEMGIIKKPGILPVTVDFVEDGSGIVHFTIVVERADKAHLDGANDYHEFYFETRDYYLNVDSADYTGKLFEKPLKTGTYHLEIPISSKMQNGIYVMTVHQLYDRAGNKKENPDINKSGEPVSAHFQVEDEFDYDFEVGIASPSLLKKVKSMPEGSAGKVMLRKEKKNILKKSVLDAIAGKNKTLVLYESGYQWIINGKQIAKDKTKNLDLSVYVTTIRGEDLGIKNDAAGLVFADNGKLPGEIQFRFKSACMKELANKADALRLYHILDKGQTERNELDLEGVSFKEEDTDFEIIPDGASTWCYVDISHNSSFVVSGQKIVAKKNPMKVKVVKKTLEATILKKKAKRIKPIIVKKAKGKVRYKVVGGKKKAKKALTLSKKTGKIKVKKGTKKGTYKLKVKVTAYGKAVFKKKSKTVTVVVKVK